MNRTGIKILSPLDKLHDARLTLMSTYRFWGYLSLRLNFIECEDGGGMGTTAVDSEGNFYYNPDFIKDKETKEVVFLVTHELMHLVQHCIQRFNSVPTKKQEKMIWNIAADYVADTNISDDGYIELPHFRKSFITKEVMEKSRDKVIEEVYLELLKDPENLPQPICCSAQKILEGNSKNKKSKKKLGQAMSDAQKHKWTQHILSAKKAEDTSSGKGSVPGFVKDFIARITNPTVNWKDKIRYSANSKFRKKYSFSKPNRRSHKIGVRLQSRLPKKEGAVLMFDTSGSISVKELHQAASEATGILNACGAAFVHVFFHDVNCYYNAPFSREDLKHLKVTRGGTSHIDVFDKVNETLERVGMVVAFTDLETDFPKEDPGYPVLWCHAKGRGRIDPPFGKKVEMILNQEEDY